MLLMYFFGTINPFFTYSISILFVDMKKEKGINSYLKYIIVEVLMSISKIWIVWKELKTNWFQMHFSGSKITRSCSNILKVKASFFKDIIMLNFSFLIKWVFMTYNTKRIVELINCEYKKWNLHNFIIRNNV